MNQSLRNILFLTIPASALMFLLADPVITLLLQKGMFTRADTLATAPVLRSLSLGIFAWSCQSLLTRGFYALQNSKVPVISGAIVSVLFVAMNAWVVRPVIGVKARVDTLTHQIGTLQANVKLVQPFVAPSQAALSAVSAAQSAQADAAPSGAPNNDLSLRLGAAQDQLTQLAAQAQAALTDAQARLDSKRLQLAVAQSELNARAARAVWELGLTTTVAATIHTDALYFLLRRRLTGLHSQRLVSSLGKILMATLALCVLTKLVLAICETGFETSHLAPKLTALVTLSLAGLAGLAAFLGTARALRMAELQSAIDLIRRKRG